MKDYTPTYIEKINALLPNIDVEDKVHAMQAADISRPTLDRYLKGEIIKQDTALKIIKVLTGRVNERYNTLKEIQLN